MKLFDRKSEFTLIPLRDIVAFPSMVIPFYVGRSKSIRAIELARERDHTLFLATQKNTSTEDPGEDDIHRVGVVAKILQVVKLPDDTLRLLVEAERRAAIVKYTEKADSFKVLIQAFKEDARVTPQLATLTRTIARQFSEYATLHQKIPSEVVELVSKVDSPDKLVNTVCANVQFSVEQKVELLSETVTRVRLDTLATLLGTEIEMLQIQQKINDKVKKKLDKTQREYFLHEQMREIQRELGGDAEDPTGASEIQEKLAKKELPSDIADKCEKEIKRLSRIQPISPESAVLRTYLEWILDIPWNETSQDIKEIDHAQKILDEDHYNLKKVKERILDFIAVRQLRGKTKGPILCFVGPPGTGKTSLGRSVARCLDRKFVRISLGGVRDEAEIRGHRKTYVGALPGKIIQSMRRAGTRNPVFLLDEIDKMGSDYRGDPASALLEVLDPEQNSTFMDHYLEVQYDLSDVMFITTANSVHNIPYPLRDRMEVILIPGYTEFEKLKIAQRFLIPKQIQENGLEWASITFRQSAIFKVIRNYTMEAGVRNLEREIANILRKIARKAIKRNAHAATAEQGDNYQVVVTEQAIVRYLENEKYIENLYSRDSTPGLAYGLAWTELGGMLLPVEVAILAGEGNLHLTGSLGDVMKESAQAALSFLRANANALGICGDFTKNSDIHVHVPEGAIPKDGPSAGITIAAALLSAVTDTPLKKGYCMTGEITLTGRMLAIGGVKEKLLAAHRHQMSHVVIPELNKKDLHELPKEVVSVIELIFTDSAIDALGHLFPDRMLDTAEKSA